MPVPFGVSVGDFVAVLGLIRKVSKALEHSHGASAQYQTVKAILDNLKAALEQIKTLGINAGPLAPKLRQATKQLLDSIGLLLRKIQCFDASLKAGSSCNKLKAVIKKVRWAVFTMDDVQQFQAQILGYMSSIQLFLITSQR